MQAAAPLTRTISPARLAAFEVLEKVDSRAYASDTLRERNKDIASRDAGLAAQIVLGCLRYQSQLDYLILKYSERSAEELDSAVRLALRMGIFQLRYLQRIPPHAAVHESVELVKAHRRAAAGFANAVLRKVNRQPVNWPDHATEVSGPAWLIERWAGHFGPGLSTTIALSALAEPIPYIRVPAGSNPPENVELEPTEVPGAYRVLSQILPEMRLHDISSQTILPLLDLRPGLTYLDLCAAPGNKTEQALETPLALAIACDVSWKRLRQVAAPCPRVVLDATEPLPFEILFDRIFVDAPCSGTGTLGRNPEIKWRVTPQDFTRFHAIQVAILSAALPRLAPGGKLLYATCSLETEENESVIEQVTKSNPAIRLESENWRIPGREAGDGFYAALLSR